MTDNAVLLFALRTGFNLTALLAIGLALHAAFGVVERNGLRQHRRWLIAAAAAAAVFAAARLAFVAWELGDGSELLDLDLISFAWMTLQTATTLLWAGAIITIIGALMARRVVLGVGAFFLGAGFSFTGHTQGLDSPGLAPAAVALHVLLAGYWVAAPITLWPLHSFPDAALHARLERFSAAAMSAIPLLMAVGVWLAWTLAGGVEGLTGTPYGQLLLIKLAVASFAMGIGALNKQFVTARVASDPGTGRRWLRRTLGTEAIMFAMAILAVSAATTLTGVNA